MKTIRINKNRFELLDIHIKDASTVIERPDGMKIFIPHPSVARVKVKLSSKVNIELGHEISHFGEKYYISKIGRARYSCGMKWVIIHAREFV